jgi:Putative cyclase
VFQINRNSWDKRLHDFHPQESSQWDGFQHVRHREFGFHGEVQAEPSAGTSRLRIYHWSAGIIGRGVPNDVERHSGRTYDPLTEAQISASELKAAAEHECVEPRSGDTLAIRFGWTKAHQQLTSEQRAAMASQHRPPFAGLSGDEQTARILWGYGISAVIANNPAVESAPGESTVGSLHRRPQACLGMPMREPFDLEHLGAACAADGAGLVHVRGRSACPGRRYRLAGQCRRNPISLLTMGGTA